MGGVRRRAIVKGYWYATKKVELATLLCGSINDTSIAVFKYSIRNLLLGVTIIGLAILVTDRVTQTPDSLVVFAKLVNRGDQPKLESDEYRYSTREKLESYLLGRGFQKATARGLPDEPLGHDVNVDGFFRAKYEIRTYFLSSKSGTFWLESKSLPDRYKIVCHYDYLSSFLGKSRDGIRQSKEVERVDEIVQDFWIANLGSISEHDESEWEQANLDGKTKSKTNSLQDAKSKWDNRLK